MNVSEELNNLVYTKKHIFETVDLFLKAKVALFLFLSIWQEFYLDPYVLLTKMAGDVSTMHGL